jgi:hypothetical protein
MHRNGLFRIFALSLGLFAWPSLATSQVFEVIHPDVVQGGFEMEFLNGMTIGDVEDGEERSAHEIALGYGVFDFWKTTLAIEIANPESESAEFEAFEWVNVFLLPFGTGHGGEHDHSEHDFVALEAVGVFAALEVPNHGGLNAGAAEIGPIAEIAIGPVETVVNFVLEFPFDGEESTGFAYAIQAKYPIVERIELGFEAFGGWENVFEDDREDAHFIGPAIFGEFDLGRGRVLEPKLGILFGLTDDAPDAVISLNIELKF